MQLPASTLAALLAERRDHGGLLSEWPEWLVALAFGLGSSLSFPVGAAVGALLTPSRKEAPADEKQPSKVTAHILAFGAGTLLFAVTVELYGEAMTDLAVEGYAEGLPYMATTLLYAMLGAVLYVWANRWLQATMAQPESHSLAATERTPLRGLPDLKRNLSMSSAMAAEERRSLLIGIESWFGVLISGVPEAFLLGILAAEKRLSIALVVALFVSNFPTAWASASFMKLGGKSSTFAIIVWALVCLMTGALAGVVPIAFPHMVHEDHGWSRLIGDAIEGLAGGSMLACICAVMLPEAYHVTGDDSALMAVAGFLFGVVVKVFGGLAQNLTGQGVAHQ